MSKMDFDLLTSAQSRLNPMNERELDLRGFKIQKIENLALTRDVNDCLDFTDNDIAKLVSESERIEALKLFSGKEGNELLKELTEHGMTATFDPEEILETKKTISKEEQLKIREAIKNAKTLSEISRLEQALQGGIIPEL
ncbi:U2 small nuclear ribonucleoprotein [Boothiomyces sp. JEL0838]|nr:U2 small nuclear ribonucleoprotein [Boothiomyces sp. JEL0838]